MAGLLVTEARIIDVPQLAAEALWQELDLTPKPGLVDKQNSGAHRDMDYRLFARSIAAITPWFTRFAGLGHAYADKPASDGLKRLRPMGVACEQAMYTATGGVNTHKGGIFALGLLCFVAGRVPVITAQSLCCETRKLCHGLVARELAARSVATTAGEIAFQRHGLAGARGEAESGFATVRAVLGQRRDATLHELLLRLMAVNQDSNLVSRGGIAGLRYVQDYAQDLLKNGWDRSALADMDHALTARNLSPGGSADLLSVARVLQQCG